MHAAATPSCPAAGIWVATAVVAMWAGTVALGAWLLGACGARGLWLVVPVVIVVRAFANTGLFITAHDAMHGLVHAQRRTNDAIGALCLALFAFLPYARMRRAHHEHHRVPAQPGDPDFVDARFWRWFVGFFSGYVSWRIVALNAVWQTLLVVAGVPLLQVIAVLFVPAFLSALQLFYFGTYRPHRTLVGEPFADAHRARSASVTSARSFFECYHFGYHWEHHDAPWLPWWRLPQRRATRLR